MKLPIIYTKKHKEHNPPYEIYDGVKESYAEKADRIESIVTTLKNNNFTSFMSPRRFSLDHIHALHQKVYVDFVRTRSKRLRDDEILYPSYFIMDTYSPITAGTYGAAYSSVNVALTGAELIIGGENIVYSLCRPPGHHAEQKMMGGYCYFNNAAIAAHYLAQHGKVAILDVDFHHGNGTQNLFYDRSDVLYVSIHADPKVKFPYSSGFSDEKGRGEGEGYTMNYPLPLGTTPQKYQKFLQRALSDIRIFKPDYLIVSLGFDTYEHDPIGGFQLTIPYYQSMAEDISTLKVPTLLVQEGGYNISDLGEMATSFLKGFEKLSK
ncbi:MAG: Hist deacetyl protein [Patescibacteria group bacterium]|nr:Hist deacetyl protein [Patescibacteria group bacterium]